MDGSASRAQVIKPVLLKVGIPLALSVAGFICAKVMMMMARKDDKVSSLKTESYEKFEEDHECYHSLNSTSSSFKEDEELVTTSTHFMNSIGVSEFHDSLQYEQEILSLRYQIEELRKTELETKLLFVRYHDLKEQESVLIELRNMLLLEKSYVELLDREISLEELEKKRLENLVVQYLKVLERLQHSKSENGLLKRKAKKLVRKTKELSKIIREQNLKIEYAETELLRNCGAMEEMSNAHQKLENEVKELHTVIDRLQEQKNDLLNKLQESDQSASSVTKIEGEGTTMEDYNQLLNKYEQLQKDRDAEVKELIYLRWTNACLRHELMRNQQQQQQNQEKNNIEEFEGDGGIGDYEIEQHLDGLELEHAEPFYNVANGSSHAWPKRPKLLQKLKRWVDGSEKMKSKLHENENEEIKCFGRHSLWYEAQEKHTIPARKSCSSA